MSSIQAQAQMPASHCYMGNKPQILEYTPLTPNSPPSPCQQCRGMGNGCCSQFIICCPWCSFLLEGLTLQTFPCCAGVCLPQKTFLHQLLHSNVSHSHRLQFFINCSSVSWSSLGTDYSTMGLLWHHKSWQQTCSSMSSSFHKFTGSTRSLLQHRPSMVSQPPSAIHLPQHWLLHGLQVDTCSTKGYIQVDD